VKQLIYLKNFADILPADYLYPQCFNAVGLINTAYKNFAVAISDTFWEPGLVWGDSGKAGGTNTESSSSIVAL